MSMPASDPQLEALLDAAEEVSRSARTDAGGLSAYIISEAKMKALQQAVRAYREPYRLLGGHQVRPPKRSKRRKPSRVRA
jgi:hypothetical protein